MNRLLLSLLVCLPLLGGATCGKVRPAAREAIAANCAAKCFEPCLDGKDTGIRVTGDPEDPRTQDEINSDVIDALVDKLRKCDLEGRGSCVKCIENLKAEGVIY